MPRRRKYVKPYDANISAKVYSEDKERGDRTGRTVRDLYNLGVTTYLHSNPKKYMEIRKSMLFDEIADLIIDFENTINDLNNKVVALNRALGLPDDAGVKYAYFNGYRDVTLPDVYTINIPEIENDIVVDDEEEIIVETKEDTFMRVRLKIINDYNHNKYKNNGLVASNVGVYFDWFGDKHYKRLLEDKYSFEEFSSYFMDNVVDVK